jgi:hypothetical protein
MEAPPSHAAGERSSMDAIVRTDVREVSMSAATVKCADGTFEYLNSNNHWTNTSQGFYNYLNSKY